MLRTLILTMMIFSSVAFAIDPQDGNGGNMCILKNEIHGKYPRSLDEAMVRYYDFGDIWLNSERFSDMTDLYPDALVPDKMGYVDLTNTRSGREVLKTFQAISGSFLYGPATLQMNISFAQELKSLFGLLKKVKLTNDEFLRGAGLGAFDLALCKEGTVKAVIVTLSNGTTYLSRPNWNQLTFRSRKMLLIHETLRIAQMFRPWFSKYSNEDLYRLAVLIYARDGRLPMSRAFESYRTFNIARSLKPCALQEEMNTVVESLLERNRADAAFRKTMDLSCYTDPAALTRNILLLKMNPKYFGLINSEGYDWY